MRLAVLVLTLALPLAARAEVVRLTDDLATRLGRAWKAELAAREQAKRDHAKAEKEHEAAVAAFPGKKQAYEAEKARWDGCRRAEVDPATARAEKNVSAARGDPATAQARAQAVAEKMKAAGQRGDLAEVQRLAKELDAANQPLLAAMNAGQAEMTAAAQKCGAAPKEPRAPVPPSFPGARFHDVGARVAGISEGGYRQLEERLGWALTADGGVDLQPKMGYLNSEIAPFTPAEVAVLKARGKELVAGMRAVNGG